MRTERGPQPEEARELTPKELFELARDVAKKGVETKKEGQPEYSSYELKGKCWNRKYSVIYEKRFESIEGQRISDEKPAQGIMTKPANEFIILSGLDLNAYVFKVDYADPRSTHWQSEYRMRIDENDHNLSFRDLLENIKPPR